VNEKMITVTECDDIIICIKIKNLLLKDVVLISKCTSNIISLEQLQCNDTIYQDENNRMTFTKDEHTIFIYLFILHTSHAAYKAMAVKNRK